MSENKFQFDHLVRELSPPLVVVDEKLQSIALVEAALVRHRVDENERVRPLQLTVQVFDLPRNGGLGKAVCFQTVQVGCLEREEEECYLLIGGDGVETGATHVEMSRSVDNLKRNELVVHEGRVGVLLLVHVVIRTDEPFGDKSHDHRCGVHAR